MRSCGLHAPKSVLQREATAAGLSVSRPKPAVEYQESRRERHQNNRRQMPACAAMEAVSVQTGSARFTKSHAPAMEGHCGNQRG